MGLALDADLALMLRGGAHKLASVLKRGAHRLALKLKREATQACVLMLKCDFKVRVLKSSMTLRSRVWHRTRSSRHVSDEVRV